MFGSYASAPVRNCRTPIPKTLPRICLTSQPLTVECYRGHLAGSVRVNTLTHHKPSALKRNTGYTTRGHGRGRGRRHERGCARGGSSQTPSGGSSTQIGSSQASQATMQSNQFTQEQVRSSIGSEYGGGS